MAFKAEENTHCLQYHIATTFKHQMF